MAVESSRVHKGSVITRFQGVDTVEGAMALKGKTVQLCRTDAKLPQGSFFLADIVFMDALTVSIRSL